MLRRRDERLATQDHQRAAPHPVRARTREQQDPQVFQPADFTYDADARTCVCLAGTALYPAGRDGVTRGDVADHVRGAKRDGGPCPLRAECLRTPTTTRTRQV